MSHTSATLIADDSTFLRSFADDTDESPWMEAGDLHLLAFIALMTVALTYIDDVYVSGKLAVRFPRGDGTVGQVAPDLFAAYAPRRSRDSFEVIEEGGFPAFVLEIVSPASLVRDTQEKPRFYGLIGAREYAIFDPEGGDDGRLSGYHRDSQGNWVRWLGGQSGVLFSEVLGLTLEVQEMLLRLRDQSGELLPTLAESVALRARRTKTADIEARRSDAEAQRARAVEARIAVLEAEIARLRQGN